MSIRDREPGNRVDDDRDLDRQDEEQGTTSRSRKTTVRTTGRGTGSRPTSGNSGSQNRKKK